MSEEKKDAIEKIDAGSIAVKDGSMLLTNANEAVLFARWNFESGLLPEHIRNSKQAFAIMMRGAELGLKPHASWRWLYMTKGGKIAMETKGKLAVCQAAPSFVGYREWIEHEDQPKEEWKAVAVAKRKGREDTIKEFSFRDAEAAGLSQRRKNRSGEWYDGPWQSYLKDMLLARARDRALDLAFADVLGGIPSKEIMEEVEARSIREIRGHTPETATVRDPMLDLLAPKAPVAEVEDAEIVDSREIIDAQIEEALPEYAGEVAVMPEEPPEPEGLGVLSPAAPEAWECLGCGLFQHMNHASCQRCGLKRGAEVPMPPPDEHEAMEAEAKHQREKIAAVPDPPDNPFERGRKKVKEIRKGQQQLPRE